MDEHGSTVRYPASHPLNRERPWVIVGTWPCGYGNLTISVNDNLLCQHVLS